MLNNAEVINGFLLTFYDDDYDNSNSDHKKSVFFFLSVQDSGTDRKNMPIIMQLEP